MGKQRSKFVFSLHATIMQYVMAKHDPVFWKNKPYAFDRTKNALVTQLYLIKTDK